MKKNKGFTLIEIGAIGPINGVNNCPAGTISYKTTGPCDVGSTCNCYTVTGTVSKKPFANNEKYKNEYNRIHFFVDLLYNKS